MKLPFFSDALKQTSKNYLALFLKEKEGVALILHNEAGRMILKEKERFTYSNGWEHIVEDIDEVLFRFEQRLNISLDKTIFFVYSHFIDERAQDIKKPYLVKIKEIVKNLELSPLGYIECSEAVQKYLEKKEEIPLTAILVELDKTNVGVYVYKGGRISYRKVLSRTDSLIDDLLKSFEELKGKFLLPARLILYNSKDLDDESAKIVSYRWSEDYFIQLPRVEILKEEETIEGLIHVFQEQIAKEGEGIPQVVPKKNEVFGFAIGEDVAEREEKQIREPEIPMERELPIASPFVLGVNVKEVLKRIKIPKLKLLRLNISRRTSILLGIVVIVLGLFLNEFFFHKAVITIYLPSDTISKKITVDTILGDTKEELPILASTSSASFTELKSTTGKRDIGDNAKGAVTLNNYDDNEKAFTKGTTLTANNLQFVLDADVKVASASLTPDGTAKLPGKGNGTITASDIGPESNLDKGTRFKINNLSPLVYFAVNPAALTGGTRRQIQTVSKQDMNDLETKITNKAATATSGASGSAESKRQDEIVISALSKIQLRDLRFSKELGEEASDLTLQATADTVYFYFNKGHFFTYLTALLSPEVKNGFSLEKENIQYVIDSAAKKNNAISIHMSLTAKSLKKVSKDDIVKNILGKNNNSIELILKKKYQAKGFELSIQEPLPVLNTLMPVIPNNIRVVISSL